MRYDTDREDQRAADPANRSHWTAPLRNTGASEAKKALRDHLLDGHPNGTWRQVWTLAEATQYHDTLHTRKDNSHGHEPVFIGPHAQPATPLQVDYLVSHGVPEPEARAMSRRGAAERIGELVLRIQLKGER